MKRFEIFYCLFSILLFLGCNERKEVKLKYYDSGKLHCRIEMRDSLFDGEYLEYYENGTLMKKINFTNGLQNGKGKYYFPNGKIEIEDNFVNGVSHGEYKMFNKNGVMKEHGQYFKGNLDGLIKTYYDDGKLEKIREYITVNDINYTNSEIIYNTDGTVKYKSHIISVSPKYDTIDLNSENLIKIALEGERYGNKMIVYIGKFDDNWNLDTSKGVDTIAANQNFIATYKFIPKERGILEVKGKISDIKFDNNHEVGHYDSFFKYKVYVR